MDWDFKTEELILRYPTNF